MSDQHLAGIEEKKKPLNTDKMFKIGFFGGGKMAQALAKGFIRAGKYHFLFSWNSFNDNNRINRFE